MQLDPTPSSRAHWPVVGVLLAAGSGTRSGLDYPKQFLRLGGMTVLEHTLRTFGLEPTVDEIVVVGAPDWLGLIQEIVLGSGVRKVCAVIPGGERRNDSTHAALEYLESEKRHRGECKVLMHDAVRPLVDRATLRDCVRALDIHDAVDVVIESADTIVEVDNDLLTGIPSRSRLRRGQTPQGFALHTLRSAYKKIPANQLKSFTDDCAVVMTAFPELPIATVNGSDENIKITNPMDIYLADRLLQGRQVAATSLSDRDLLLPGHTVVIGGSSGIGAALVESLKTRGVRTAVLSRDKGNVDVRSETQIERALSRLRDDVGPIDAVVNSAGLLTRGSLANLSVADVREGLEVNLLGAVHVARASYPYLCETRGKLLFFTSSSYTRGRAEYGIYSAAKAGVVNLTQALAEEWSLNGVTVNCINPGRTKTPMRTKAFGEEPVDSLLPAQRVADVAMKVLGESVTGHVFDVRLEA